MKNQMPAGTLVPAGLSHATVLPDFDFETYSEAGFFWNEDTKKWTSPPGGGNKKGLPLVGMSYYAAHPSTEIICLAYDLKDGEGPQHWRPGLPAPVKLFNHIKNGGLLEAVNAGFEYVIWNYCGQNKYGFPPLPLLQLRCAAAKARAFALPGALDKMAKVLKLKNQKAEMGKRLIDKFSKPRNPTRKNPRKRLQPWEDGDVALFYEYNIQDIIAEAEASQKIPDLTHFELTFWYCDQLMNNRGVQVDSQLVESALKVIEECYEKYNNELNYITLGAVSAATEIQKMTKWLNRIGVKVFSLNKEAVAELLTGDLPSAARRVLEIRTLVGKASVKKLYAIRNRTMSDNRIRDLFVYHGARTGRTAGRGPQPQNLPNSGPSVIKCKDCNKYGGDKHSRCPYCNSAQTESAKWCENARNDALELINYRSSDVLEHFFGDAIATISGCVRGFFIAKPGHTLICSDYSAIEAVVLAMLAGEQWRIDVFKTHGMIYEMSAAKITGVPFEEFINHKKQTGSHHPLRKTIGKVAELASGYQGGLKAWHRFGADEFFDDEQIKKSIKAWRKESPAIVAFWGGQQKNWKPELHGIEGAAISAITHPGYEFEYRNIKFLVKDDILYCKLLSGRYLTYHTPRLRPSVMFHDQKEITYMGWNTNTEYGAPGWQELKIYGGRLTENIVQATARDILANADINLENSSYPVVLHVHDEIVCELPNGQGSVKELEHIMMQMPAWAKDWPIKATNGWRGLRYGKD